MGNDCINTMGDSQAYETGLFHVDEEVYERLFVQYWKALYKQAYGRLLDVELAKDMVQEVFADLWQRRDNLTLHTSVEAYLSTSLKHRIMRAASREELHKRAVTHLVARMELMENTILERLAAGDLRKTIAQVLDTFPANMKEVFLLRAEDFSVEEVARAMGLAVQTVKNNHSEALKRLRLSLVKQYPGIGKSIYALVYMVMNS